MLRQNLLSITEKWIGYQVFGKNAGIVTKIFIWLDYSIILLRYVQCHEQYQQQ